MTDLFPRAGFLRSGYDRNQVDEFFARARAAYERPHMDEQAMSALDIRRAAFDLKRGGYKTAPVDDALDRLEAAFAQRVREQYVRAHGHDAWMRVLAERAQVLYPRLRRPHGERFRHPDRGKKGYSAAEVDALLDRLIAFFDTGAPVTADDLRTATFASKGGKKAYDERTVDVYLARAIDILLGAS